jgi:hypothetical protein
VSIRRDASVISLEQQPCLAVNGILKCGLLSPYTTGGFLPSYQRPGWSAEYVDEASWVSCLVYLELHEAVHGQPSDAVVQRPLRQQEVLTEDIIYIAWLMAVPCVQQLQRCQLTAALDLPGPRACPFWQSMR